MNEPPIKKAYISLPNTQCIINTGNDTDDDTESDVGIQFSVDSHSSSGDRCSNSLSPEGRRSFCSDGFQPSYEDILEFTSSDKGWQCVDNENNNTLITDDKTDDDDDDTQKYELIINDSCSVASEGFNPYNASVKDIAEGTECITDRGLLSSNIEVCTLMTQQTG
ncbi:hypothetical protein LSH36_31g00042 [Paralvinella palmiformis]|uniref:Uncharacterized protein n=1 Tax=Paralvinella palmiformis TaxID=53620 RepID=A0AAD9K9R6_9ANNE|nr:hypothetical protein LSH36_31g00042 [Paralvinella palmiformis]